jgi:molecular chaperone GrpE
MDDRNEDIAEPKRAEEPAPANANGEDRATEPPSPEERVKGLEAELGQMKDRMLRALAEAENTRRRAEREREETQKYAIADFARDLLGTADNLRRALESLPDSEVRDERTRNLLAGVAATERELLAVFERRGIRRLDPKGERFDHNQHQAIYEVATDEVRPGTVVEVLQPGYVLQERLLRPAMVGVAKETEKPSQRGEAGGEGEAKPGAPQGKEPR